MAFDLFAIAVVARLWVSFSAECATLMSSCRNILSRTGGHAVRRPPASVVMLEWMYRSTRI